MAKKYSLKISQGFSIRKKSAIYKIRHIKIFSLHLCLLSFVVNEPVWLNHQGITGTTLQGTHHVFHCFILFPFLLHHVLCFEAKDKFPHEWTIKIPR